MKFWARYVYLVLGSVLQCYRDLGGENVALRLTPYPDTALRYPNDVCSFDHYLNHTPWTYGCYMGITLFDSYRSNYNHSVSVINWFPGVKMIYGTWYYAPWSEFKLGYMSLPYSPYRDCNPMEDRLRRFYEVCLRRTKPWNACRAPNSTSLRESRRS